VTSQIVITIPGDPVPWARAGARGAIRFTPKKQSNWMTVIRDYAARVMDGRALLDGPVRMDCTFVYLVPTSWSKKKAAAAQWKTTKPDKDNLEKIVKDSLNGVVFRDDAQVCAGGSEKRYGDKPGTIIVIEALA